MIGYDGKLISFVLQSFPNQSFWMARSSGIPSDGDMAYETSSKRPHQLLDGLKADLLPNKKLAPEISTSNLFSGVINSNVPAWGNTYCFQSNPGQFTERLFDTETTRAARIHDKSVHSINTEKVILGRSGIEEPYIDHSFALSMSHTLEDPQSAVSYGGIRKVKVSQVKKDSDSLVSSTNAQNYDRTDNRSVSATNVYRVDQNSMCMGLAFGKEEENIIAESYERENGVFISMGQPYSKGDENISLAPYNDSNSFASDLGFNKVDSNLISMGQTYSHVDEIAASKGSIFHKESTPVCRDGVYNNNSNIVQDSCSKGQSTIISFGGSNDDDANNTGRIISSYELLMAQSTPQLSETPTNKDLVGSRTNGLGGDATFSSIDVSAKKEETKVSKKVQSNSFPSNVRSLLSTGMLDGVPVKYIAWSREVANLLALYFPKIAINGIGL